MADEYNAYEAFHESLNATGVLSDSYRHKLGAILNKAMEQAADSGRAQGQRMTGNDADQLRDLLAAERATKREATDHYRRVLARKNQEIAALKQALEERA